MPASKGLSSLLRQMETWCPPSENRPASCSHMQVIPKLSVGTFPVWVIASVSSPVLEALGLALTAAAVGRISRSSALKGPTSCPRGCRCPPTLAAYFCWQIGRSVKSNHRLTSSLCLSSSLGSLNFLSIRGKRSTGIKLNQYPLCTKKLIFA